MDMPSLEIEHTQRPWRAWPSAAELEARFAALEAETRSLRAEVLALRSKAVELETHGMRKRVPPPSEPATRIVTPAPKSNFQMPPSEELDRLLKIVTEKYPQYACSVDQFRVAFEAVGGMKRTAEPDRKHYVSHYTDLAERLLRSWGKGSVSVDGNAFIAACLAHGDIAISGIGMRHSGYSIEVGLSEYTGRDAGTAWRNVLQTRQLMPPAAVAPRVDWNPRDLSNYVR